MLQSPIELAPLVQLPKKPLTNLQLELLKFFSLELNEDEMDKLRKLLLDIIVERLDTEVDKVWEERGYTEETVNEWLHTHMRTPYREQV
jgi:hypothetical protein